MIRIEVTGNSIAEVADKLLAIGGNLRGEFEYQTITPPPSSGEVVAGPIDEIVYAPDVVVSPAPEVAKAAVDPEPTLPASASELNFDTDVAPHVLQVVRDKGKPAAEKILSQFGVAKASLLNPTRWPELVEALKGAL